MTPLAVLEKGKRPRQWVSGRERRNRLWMKGRPAA